MFTYKVFTGIVDKFKGLHFYQNYVFIVLVISLFYHFILFINFYYQKRFTIIIAYPTAVLTKPHKMIEVHNEFTNP